MRDDIYQHKKDPLEKFTFSKEVSDVFDDMINRSVPGYKDVLNMSGEIIKKFYQPDTMIYDLGASTGALPLKLIEIFQGLRFRYKGIDNSLPMVEKARSYLKKVSHDQEIDFMKGDIEGFFFKDASVIVSSYTMQFIPPERRESLFQEIYNSLTASGIFILSEKVVEEDERLNLFYQERHYQMKKKEGYSDLEIAQKRDAIENVLIPFTFERNIEMLRRCGFSTISIFYKWYNFVSILAVK